MLAIDPTYHRTGRRLALLVATLAALLPCAGTARAGTARAGTASSPAASSGSTLVISGGGYGHGVGMSQQGALGYAEHGFDYAAILAHYYMGTSIGTAPAHAQVRVMMGGKVRRLALETYVRGVVSAEVSSSWPLAALEAQAIASRTYALTAHAGGAKFDVYADTRSQVYRGVAAQTPQTDAAVAATAGQIVTYGGHPAITYFFASSGGRTESVENAFPGSEPQPWLRGVVDQYERGDGHTWKTALSFAAAAAKLRGFVRGSFRGIEVLKRGYSPRIVSAYVLGTGGRTPISGPELAARLGLYSTWAYFSTRQGRRTRPEPDRSGYSAPGAPAAAAGASPALPTGESGGVSSALSAEAAATSGGSAGSAPTRAGASGGTEAPG